MEKGDVVESRQPQWIIGVKALLTTMCQQIGEKKKDGNRLLFSRFLSFGNKMLLNNLLKTFLVKRRAVEKVLLRQE